MILDLQRLSAKKRPAPGNKKNERYQYYVELKKAVSRLDKLCKVSEINIEKLTGVLYSRGTMHALIILLPDDDRDQLRREMTSWKIDWQNPGGITTFALFKEIIEMERNILESCKGIDNYEVSVGWELYIPKGKGVFTTTQQESDSSGDEHATHAVSTDNTKVWSNPTLNFP